MVGWWGPRAQGNMFMEALGREFEIYWDLNSLPLEELGVREVVRISLPWSSPGRDVFGRGHWNDRPPSLSLSRRYSDIKPMD